MIASVIAVLAAAGLAAAAPALASHGQLTYFEGATQLLEPSTRAASFKRLEALGVHALRVELYWSDVAPGADSATKPAFDAESPASYDFSRYDAVLAEAKRLGWPVLLTVTGPAPRWATSNHKAPYITRPDPLDFGQFMTAVARNFTDEVSIYSIWNEPNHPAFLLPQWTAKGTPASPRIYRALYQDGYEGLQKAGLTQPKVLFGETAPTGYDTVNLRREGSAALLHDVAPLLFLRSALCLNAHYKRIGSCSELPMSGYAHHAYTLPAGPFYVDPLPDSVQIGTLSRLERALTKAAAAHAIPAHVPIYLTEFGVQSVPNQLGVPLARQAEFDAIDEQIAWSDPRVAAFSQYLLQDDKPGGPPGASVHGGTVGFQTGLITYTGGLKPLYKAWSLPLTVTKQGRSYSLWGLVRPTNGATNVTVLVPAGHSSKYRVLKTVATERRGYWTLNSNVAGSYWKVRWRSPTGVAYEGPPIRAYP